MVARWVGAGRAGVPSLAPTAVLHREIRRSTEQTLTVVQATGFDTYRTSGQRAATRAAISMPDDGTLIALLPDGSGKTEVAVTLAHLARRQTTLVVVPTVGLAYDFERRFHTGLWKVEPEGQAGRTGVCVDGRN